MNKIETAKAMLTEIKWFQSYNGRSGCACGCRGNYNERAAIVERQRVKMIELLNYAEENEVLIYNAEEGRAFVAIETPYNGRVATIYTEGF